MYVYCGMYFFIMNIIFLIGFLNLDLCVVMYCDFMFLFG